ncbi:MAG: hypothetical protein E7166_05500 [Firmicutes bacterium]|nr:hypothetical protein [Bacillota bacterium]
MENEQLENEQEYEFDLLSKKFISQFNMEKTEENVSEIMSKFFKAQYKFTNILPPRMTPNYELRYEYITMTYSDSLGDHVADKLDTKQEIINFYNTIAGAITRMNTIERVYYVEMLLNSKSERHTADVIGVSRRLLPTIKNSCILKIALAFGEEVEL